MIPGYGMEQDGPPHCVCAPTDSLAVQDACLSHVNHADLLLQIKVWYHWHHRGLKEIKTLYNKTHFHIWELSISILLTTFRCEPECSRYCWYRRVRIPCLLITSPCLIIFAGVDPTFTCGFCGCSHLEPRFLSQKSLSACLLATDANGSILSQSETRSERLRKVEGVYRGLSQL